MAKLSDYDKKLLIADYHTNKYSQRELAKKYNVSIGTVNNLTKEVSPQNEHLVNAQISILSAKSILPIEHLNAILNTAQEEVYNKGLVTNASQLNLIRTTQYLANNKKLEKISVGDGIQQFEEVGLGADDFKQCQDAIDRASITLKVNERHAPRAEVKVTGGDDNSTTNTQIVFKRIGSNE